MKNLRRLQKMLGVTSLLTVILLPPSDAKAANLAPQEDATEAWYDTMSTLRQQYRDMNAKKKEIRVHLSQYDYSDTVTEEEEKLDEQLLTLQKDKDILSAQISDNQQSLDALFKRANRGVSKKEITETNRAFKKELEQEKLNKDHLQAAFARLPRGSQARWTWKLEVDAKTSQRAERLYPAVRDEKERARAVRDALGWDPVETDSDSEDDCGGAAASEANPIPQGEG